LIGKQNILILGSRAPIALEMVRSFGQAGHHVVVADCQKLTVARWSKYTYKYFHIPSPAHHFNDFSERLSEIVVSEKIDHLIPTCEEAFYVSMCKDQFTCKVWVSRFDLMDDLHHKERFISKAANFFYTPETVSVEKIDDKFDWSNFIIKKKYSRFSNAIYLKPNERGIPVGVKDHSEWIAQEFIEGKEFCVYSIWDEGKLKSCSIYHPLHRIGSGSGIFFEPADIPELEQQIQVFGEAINFTGQLSFDFIFDGKEYIVIECNPRGISGAHFIGKNLVHSFLETGKFEHETRADISIKPAILLTQPNLLLKKKTIKSKDVLWRNNDFLPALLQFLSLAELLYLSIKNKQSIIAASTYDIEWNGVMTVGVPILKKHE
jgi:predicted ATP-grasp superfamily ATP-dependent carboligase